MERHFVDGGSEGRLNRVYFAEGVGALDWRLVSGEVEVVVVVLEEGGGLSLVAGS